jgi:hypothetical protein
VKIGAALALVATVLAVGGCNRDHYYNHHTYGNDEGERYLQRKETVTLSAGDAKDVNARTHMLAAWPPGVGDRRIAMSGPRAVRAIDCYYHPQRQQQQQQGGAVSLNLNIQTGGTQGAQQQQRNC